MVFVTIKLSFHNAVKRMLPYIALAHPKNWSTHSRDYPQLWDIWYFKPKPLSRWLRRHVIEKICGVLTGHEPSETEWGYGGGDYVDRWCRWCNKLLKVHRKEAILPEVMQDIIDRTGFGKKDI